MPVSVTSFSPSTKIESSPMNTNFTTLVNALNNLRSTLYSFLQDTLTVDTNVSAEFEIKSAQTLTMNAVDLNIKTAPTGAALIVDINKNGTTIFSTRPRIADGATSGGGSAVFSSTTVVAGDIITIDIDQVGSTTPGKDLTIALSFKL